MVLAYVFIKNSIYTSMQTLGRGWSYTEPLDFVVSVPQQFEPNPPKDPVPKAPKPFILLLTVPASSPGGLGDVAAAHTFSAPVILLAMSITAVFAAQHVRAPDVSAEPDADSAPRRPGLQWPWPFLQFRKFMGCFWGVFFFSGFLSKHWRCFAQPPEWL